VAPRVRAEAAARREAGAGRAGHRRPSRCLLPGQPGAKSCALVPGLRRSWIRIFWTMKLTGFRTSTATGSSNGTSFGDSPGSQGRRFFHAVRLDGWTRSTDTYGGTPRTNPHRAVSVTRRVSPPAEMCGHIAPCMSGSSPAIPPRQAANGHCRICHLDPPDRTMPSSSPDWLCRRRLQPLRCG
jgi:hypothetical protein